MMKAVLLLLAYLAVAVRAEDVDTAHWGGGGKWDWKKTPLGPEAGDCNGLYLGQTCTPVNPPIGNLCITGWTCSRTGCNNPVLKQCYYKSWGPKHGMADSPNTGITDKQLQTWWYYSCTTKYGECIPASGLCNYNRPAGSSCYNHGCKTASNWWNKWGTCDASGNCVCSP